MLEDIASAAQHALTASEHVYLHETIHGPLWDLDELEKDAPGTVHSKEVNGHRVNRVSLAPRLRRESPQEWYAAVFRLLRSRGAKVPVKLALLDGGLRFEVEGDERVRAVLEDVVAHDSSPTLRAEAAWALRRAAALHASTADRLLHVLRADSSSNVRAACAIALGKVAPQRTDVRDQLLAILDSSAGEDVRGGAIHGLRQVALADEQLFESFVARARSPQESPWVRVACLHSIEERIGTDQAVSECVLECLEHSTSPFVQRVAAQIAAGALANRRLPWSGATVAKVESILMGVSNPCSHTCEALARLVNAKEVRGGVRLERLLRTALDPFEDRIKAAFVFGSVARREQTRDSDIDLLVIGDVRLKELAGALHPAEQALGRVINPALYTLATFRDKYQAGDPFLLEVVRKEKIFLKGDSNELGALVAERNTP
jgi:predicted nucleotidyltransferase